MVKLKFPKDDSRADGKPLSKARRWLFNGAIGRIVIGSKKLRSRYHYVLAVQFDGAPQGDYDLVSPQYIKRVKAVK